MQPLVGAQRPHKDIAKVFLSRRNSEEEAGVIYRAGLHIHGAALLPEVEETRPLREPFPFHPALNRGLLQIAKYARWQLRVLAVAAQVQDAIGHGRCVG